MVYGDIPALSKGSSRPEAVKEGIRLWSSRFCPFAERVRLILNYKQVPYDIINIDLREKPEWYSEINTLGKVPLLEEPENRKIAESLIIAEYIDDKFNSSKRLLPTDPLGRALQKMLVEQIISKISGPHQQTVLKGEEDNKTALLKSLDEVEVLLQNSFFAGEKVGFVDLMIWPWFERLPGIEVYRNMTLLSTARYPKITAWCKRMRADDDLNVSIYPAELYAEFYRTRNTNTGL